MKNSLLLITIILFGLFFSSCQKEFLDPNPKDLTIYDADALKFIKGTGISDSIQKHAINNFVNQLKDSLLWPKFMAIYPMVGGTETTNKFNLKDPRNLDAAYRLTFYGNPICTPGGMLFPTISDYADTHLADSAIGDCFNASISYYSGTQNTISGYDIGCTDGAVPYNELSVYANSADKSEWFGFSENIFSPNTMGLFMLSSSATNVTRYRNGIVVNSKGWAPNNGFTNLTFLIGKSRVTIHPGQKECELATIGNGLTDAQAFVFYNIVQNFETALGR